MKENLLDQSVVNPTPISSKNIIPILGLGFISCLIVEELSYAINAILRALALKANFIGIGQLLVTSLISMIIIVCLFWLGLYYLKRAIKKTGLNLKRTLVIFIVLYAGAFFIAFIVSFGLLDAIYAQINTDVLDAHQEILAEKSFLKSIIYVVENLLTSGLIVFLTWRNW